MFRIRSEQLDIFVELRRKQFEKEVIEHLQRCFPQKCSEVTEEGLLTLIRKSIKKAEKYEIEMKRETVKYIDLSFVFGEDFDNDPRYPHAAEALNSQNITAESKIAKLYAFFNDLPADLAIPEVN